MIGAVVQRRRIMFMSEAWVLIAIAPVLYLLSTSGHRGLRFLMLAFVFLVIGDGVLSAVLTRSIRTAAQLPPTIDIGTVVEVPIAIVWSIRGPVIAHFTDGLVSEKAGGRADVDGHLPASARRRGPVHECTITVAAGAFLGLIGFVTESRLVPAAPILVVPASLPHPDIVSRLQSITSPAEPDLIGVRPYRPGDRPGDVHWPSVARTNDIMVRERSVMPHEVPPLTIVATDSSTARLDQTLGLARFAVELAWQLGVTVTLVTHEQVRPQTPQARTGRRRRDESSGVLRPEPTLVVNELSGSADLHRALAVAVAGPPPTTAFDGTHLVIDDIRQATR